MTSAADMSRSPENYLVKDVVRRDTKIVKSKRSLGFVGYMVRDILWFLAVVIPVQIPLSFILFLPWAAYRDAKDTSYRKSYDPDWVKRNPSPRQWLLNMTNDWVKSAKERARK